MIYNYTYKLYYFIVHKLNENDSIFLFYSNTWFSTDFLYIDFITNQITNFQKSRLGNMLQPIYFLSDYENWKIFEII